MSTDTSEFVQTNTSDDPDESAHIVMLPPGVNDATPQAYVLRARIEGFPVTAVCGHVFVPKNNPEPLPTHKLCLEFFERHRMTDRDKGSDRPDA